MNNKDTEIFIYIFKQTSRIALVFSILTLHKLVSSGLIINN